MSWGQSTSSCSICLDLLPQDLGDDLAVPGELGHQATLSSHGLLRKTEFVVLFQLRDWSPFFRKCHQVITRRPSCGICPIIQLSPQNFEKFHSTLNSISDRYQSHKRQLFRPLWFSKIKAVFRFWRLYSEMEKEVDKLEQQQVTWNDWLFNLF